jgi:hypothetical protein
MFTKNSSIKAKGRREKDTIRRFGERGKLSQEEM